MAEWEKATVVSDPNAGAAPPAAELPTPTAPPKAAWESASVVHEPTLIDRIGRQVGLTARNAVEGVTAIPALGADLIGAGLNLGIRGVNHVAGTTIPEFPSQSGLIDKGLTAAGLPEENGPLERIVGAGTRGIAGAGGNMLLGAGAAPGIVKDVLMTRPDVQAQAGGVGGLASATAKEAGLGSVAQMMAGLIGGVAAPAAWSVARGIPSLAKGFTEAGQRSTAGGVLNTAAASPADSLAALADTSDIVPGSARTLAQVTRDPGLASLERALMAKPEGAAISQRYAQQNAARIAELDDLAGSDATLAFAKDARSTITTPQRLAALENANLGTSKTAELEAAIRQKQSATVQALQDAGRYKTFAAQQENLAQGGGVRIANAQGAAPGQPVNSPELNVGYNGGTSRSPSAYSAAPMPRVPPRYTENAQRVPEGQSAANTADAIVAQRKGEKSFLEYQLDSLKKDGYSPLNINQLTDGLQATATTPGLRASTVVQKTLADVRSKLEGLADANGNIDARDLYTVRKELGNTISVHAKDSGNWDKQLTAGLEKGIQNSIDGAITKAGAGDLWGRYLQDYRTASRPVNQIETLQGLRDKVLGTGEDLLGNRQILPGKFQQAMDSIDEVAAKATGFDKATAESILTPQQRTRLDSLRQDLSGEAYAKAGGKVSGSNTVQLANYSTANIIGNIVGGRGTADPITRNLARGLDWLNKYNDRDIDHLLIEAAKDPALAGTLMKSASPDRVDLASDALKNIAKSIGLGVATNQREIARQGKDRPQKGSGQ